MAPAWSRVFTESCIPKACCSVLPTPRVPSRTCRFNQIAFLF